MEPPTTFVPVTLPNAAAIRVEATPLGGFERAGGFDAAQFQGVIAAIEGIGLAVRTGLARVAPTKASVELGLEIGVESGQLTALLVKGAGKANLKVTLHFEHSSVAPAPTVAPAASPVG